MCERKTTTSPVRWRGQRAVADGADTVCRRDPKEKLRAGGDVEAKRSKKKRRWKRLDERFRLGASK